MKSTFDALLANPMSFVVLFLAGGWGYMHIRQFIDYYKLGKSKNIIDKLDDVDAILKAKLEASLKDRDDAARIENAKTPEEVFDTLKKNVEDK